jgi:hypothetical protein
MRLAKKVSGIPVANYLDDTWWQSTGFSRPHVQRWVDSPHKPLGVEYQRMANKAALATPGACAQGGAPMRCHASNDSALWIASYASRPSRNTGYSKNLAALNGEGCAQAAIC